MVWVDRCYLALAAADLGFTLFGVGLTGPTGVTISEANPVWTWVMTSAGKGAWAIAYGLQVVAVFLLARHGGRVGRMVEVSVLGATALSVIAWLFAVRMLF